MIKIDFPAVMPQFADYVDTAVDALNQDPDAEFDENAFIDASRLVRFSLFSFIAKYMLLKYCFNFCQGK